MPGLKGDKEYILFVCMIIVLKMLRKEPGFPRGYFKWCCEIANELLERIYLVERRKSLLRFDRSRIKYIAQNGCILLSILI